MKGPTFILVCEDSDDVLFITTFTLEAEGFIVITAKNTDELFLKLHSDPKPALILLDLNIPEIGGKAVIQQLKKMDDTKNIPVILFSGEEKLAEIASELKADGYLKKPFDITDLKELVAKFVLQPVK